MNFYLVVSCIAALCLAYSVYEPLPDYVQDKATLHTLNAVTGVIKHFGKLTSLMGCRDIEVISRSLINSLIPEAKNTSSVTFAYRQFANSRTLVATPSDASRRSGGGVVYIHGGGFVQGAPEMYSEFMGNIVDEVEADVFGIRYRLAPEHPFPAAFDDSLAAVEAIFDEAESMGIDRSRIAIAGDSAGGQLTAAIVQHLRMRKSRHRPKAQVLVYPVTQFVNLRTRSYIENAQSPVLKTAECPKLLAMHLFGNKSMGPIFAANGHVTPKLQAAYLSAVGEEVPVTDNEETRRRQGASAESMILDYRLSPLLNPNIDSLELPPTFVASCQFDPIREDGLMYAKRLKSAGVKVELKNYWTFHGAMTMPKDGQQIREDVLQYLRAAIGEGK